MEALTTKEKLRQVGKAEFLAKGYKDASLREIVKKSGFTLGAFYGYYPNKEALFADIVGGAAEAMYTLYRKAHTDFAELPPHRQIEELDASTGSSMLLMIELIVGEMDLFKLIFFRSAGTRYENYLQRFIDLEMDSTRSFIDTIKAQGHPIDVDEEIIHILASAMLTGMMEVVDHGMAKDKAVRYISQLRDFYSAGWHHLLGV